MNENSISVKDPNLGIHLKLLAMQSPQNQIPAVYKFLHHAFLPTRMCGIYPRDDQSFNRLFWTAYGFLVLASSSINTFYSLYYFYDVIPSLYVDNSLRLCLDRCQFFIASFSGLFCIVNVQCSAKKYAAILENVGKVDSVLHSNGIDLKFKYAQSYVQFFVRMVILVVFTIINASYISSGKDHGCDPIVISSLIGTTAPLAIVSAMEYQHSVLMSVIEARFGAIRDRVTEIGKKASSMPDRNDMAEAESLVKIYNHLNEAASLINEIYGKQLLFVIGTIFAIVTSKANYVVQDVILFITQRTVGSPLLLLLTTYWGGFRLLELWRIISACDAVVEKAREFTAELYQLMIDDNSLKLSKNKKLYLHISSQKDPVFTAHGFFTLDNSLFHSVIAAATTYLVILIQFSQSSNGDKSSDSSNQTQIAGNETLLVNELNNSAEYNSTSDLKSLTASTFLSG
ncbi:Gustatory Receptor [Nesidiocoris tenuis]|uniref:Gustatory receptor n=1 Tax=Nesidiocoris tenuis TaxID=355587 RepID=A0ABN7AWG8_9HEMI|nr:Gustatory Receptor [Nesidiocoris tenuis]